MSERFISEQLKPIMDGPAPVPFEAGAPMMPPAFEWRRQRLPVLEVLESWKELSPCSSGSPERYLRRHWYRLRTSDEQEMTVYFLRQAQSGKQPKSRWFLYKLEDGQT